MPTGGKPLGKWTQYPQLRIIIEVYEGEVDHILRYRELERWETPCLPKLAVAFGASSTTYCGCFAGDISRKLRSEVIQGTEFNPQRAGILSSIMPGKIFSKDKLTNAAHPGRRVTRRHHSSQQKNLVKRMHHLRFHCSDMSQEFCVPGNNVQSMRHTAKLFKI